MLAVTEHPYPMHRPHPGWAENDPADGLAAVEIALGALLGAAGAAGALGSEVGGLFIVGQRDRVFLLDDHHRALAPAIHWTDPRDPAGTEAVFRRVGRDRIIEVSVVPATPGLVLPNLDWTRRALPGARAVGTLTRAAARRLGLTTGVVEAAGGGGDQAATLDCGVTPPGELSLGTGSSPAWRAIVTGPRPDHTGRLCIARHVVSHTWIHEVVAVGIGTMLRWTRETFGADADDETRIAKAAAVPPRA
ncbi:MAG: FGGY family carbohydrate kinase, partial [Chloroflexota bacterium]